MLGLVVALGGYTAAESATQSRSAAVEQSTATSAAQSRLKTAGERARAVATAQSAVADANAVQTVAAASVSETDRAALADAVDRLNTLIAALADDAASPAAEAAARDGRASRGAERSAVPDPAATDAAATPDPAATDSAATDSAAPDPTATPDPSATPEPSATDSAATATAAPTTGSRDLFRAPLDDAVPDDELAAGMMASAARVADLTARLKATADTNVAAAAEKAATAVEAERVAALAAKEAAQRESLAAYANGRVPADALCALGFASGQQLRCDAVEALAALNASYHQTFGSDLVVTDSYRSYGAQVACSRTKGGLCAKPGTSNHGRGVAVDLGGGMELFGSSQHEWMARHAGEFGWVLPAWAGISGSKREPWHWEFTG